MTGSDSELSATAEEGVLIGFKVDWFYDFFCDCGDAESHPVHSCEIQVRFPGTTGSLLNQNNGRSSLAVLICHMRLLCFYKYYIVIVILLI